jgi:hypothetical protein
MPPWGVVQTTNEAYRSKSGQHGALAWNSKPRKGFELSTIRRSRTLLVGLFAALALMLGVTVAPASAATYTASVTIHARLCPTGGPTTDIFTDCHPHPAWAGTKFKINNKSSKAINSAGNVTFSGLGAGYRTVTETAGYQPNEFLHVRVFCSADGGAAVELPISQSGGLAHFSFWLDAGSHVTCDYYFIPESAA